MEAPSLQSLRDHNRLIYLKFHVGLKEPHPMPNSWRDFLLQAFAPHTTRLTLVADPDGLLLEEGILQGLQERGYALLNFDDPVAFRYTYEVTYRTRWDQGEATEQHVILRTPAADL
jgi:hypothetical protein